MEYVEGKPLTDHAKEKRLSLKDRIELFLSVCDAVEHAHRRGIIHRDLKPGNILVDGEGKPRVLDFGLARATDADVRVTTVHTEIGKLVGTVPYMSPEQFSGDPDATDTRSDVYALGVVLYELLAGKPPFHIGRGAIAEAARIVRDTEAAALSSVDRVLRGDLEVIVGKALAKEKDRRYQSVSDLAGDIRRYLQHKPILAKPAGMWYHACKFAQRKKLVLALVAMLVGAVAVGNVLVIVQSRRSSLARAAAEREADTAREVLSFLVGVVSSAKPAGVGREASILDAVRHAAAGVSDQFSDRPGIAAELHLCVAKTLRSLAVFSEAETHARESLRLFETVEGREADKTYDAMGELGNVLCLQGRLDEAETLYQRALDGLTRLHSSSHESAIGALSNLAGVKLDRGLLDESIRLFTDAVRRSESVHGAAHRETLEMTASLAVALMTADRFADAEPVLRRVAETSARTIGEQHVETLSRRLDLGSCLLELGRYDEVETLCKGQIESIRSAYGQDHPEMVRFLQLQATLLRRLKRTQEAEPLFQTALAIAERIYPGDHWQLPVYRLDLARCWRELGRFGEAETMMLAAWAQISGAMDSDHPQAIMNIRALVRLYEDWGKADEAARWRAMLPADPPTPAPGAQGGR